MPEAGYFIKEVYLAHSCGDLRARCQQICLALVRAEATSQYGGCDHV